MKKRISVVAVLAIAFALALAVIGCTQNRVYYTMAETPNHVEYVKVMTDGSSVGDKKGDYVINGSSVTVSVALESGYELGSMKVFANGEEIPLQADSEDLSNIGYSSKNSFTAGDRLAITFTGEPELITSNVVLNVTNFYESDAELLSDVMIEVSGIDGVSTLKDFKQKSVEQRTVRGVKANEEFTVFVYTEGYDKVPFKSCSLTATYLGAEDGSYFFFQGNFVTENNRYGIKYRDTVLADVNLNFDLTSGGNLEINMSDVSAEGAVRQIGLQNNGLFEIKVNGQSRAFNEFYTVPFYFEDFNANQEVEIGIVFDESVGDKWNAILNGLEFTVSLDANPVSYEVNGTTVTMKLKRPYEYAKDSSNSNGMDPQYAYRYLIYTNLLQKLEAVGLTIED